MNKIAVLADIARIIFGLGFIYLVLTGRFNIVLGERRIRFGSILFGKARLEKEKLYLILVWDDTYQLGKYCESSQIPGRFGFRIHSSLFISLDQVQQYRAIDDINRFMDDVD